MNPLARRRYGRAAVLLGLALALAACSSAPSSSSSQAGRRLKGGVVYFAEQPSSPPNYIFPLISGEYWTLTNVFDLQQLLYRPLYFFGANGRETVDYSLSLAEAPRYSDRDSVVTITMKHYKWSDGETVSARDVVFWINLLKANKDEWASYVPGGFPDNVVSVSEPNARTVVLHLNRSYNPTWFTYNELSQITPLPIAWDRTSLSQPAPSATAAHLPDTTTAGARAVYKLLNAQSEDLSTYATSPIWRVVDGPWRLSAFTTTGRATFVPNPHYSGPVKPTISEFVDLPFTSDTAEFDLLQAGSAYGGPGTSGDEITVGYLPDQAVPRSASLEARGFKLDTTYPAQFDYFEPNFNNPSVGAILRQLYFRQAFQHLVNQTGWIKAFYDGVAVPTYGPIPPVPANPYADSLEKVNPYPFSVKEAKSILSSHGWKVRPGGLTTCAHAGTGKDECGAGIPAGKALSFTLMYPVGYSYTDSSMANLASTAKEVGIELSLREVSEDTITGTILPCASSSSSCSWEIGQYAVGWPYNPDHYPTGEEIFATGALGNVSNYSNATSNKLIEATTTASSSGEQKALDAYQNQIRTILPNFWQPSPGEVVSLQGNLKGYVFNPYSAITPEDWYFVKH